MDQQKLLPEEQKGGRKRSRRTNDLLYIDRAVFREVKSRKKKILATAWIVYKRPYEWTVMLCAENSELGEVDIKRGIFQGDSLSPLVFVF